MIEVTNKTVFIFNISANGLTYNFQVFADNQEAARKQLSEALRQMAEELNSMKAGLKAS